MSRETRVPWTELFDGKTLDGWSNPYEWGEARVENGEIRLQAERKFFLTTERTFADFEFEVDVLLPAGKANSGIMLRCHREPNRVYGYQAEVDGSDRRWSGGLYDEGRRGWLRPLDGDPAAQAAFRRDDWNHYRVLCVGDRLRIWVNGQLTTDYRDPLDLEGHIALQHHGEKGQVYRFRRPRVRDLGRHHWRPMLDGEGLAGWTATPGGDWRVDGTTVTGRSPASLQRNSWLLSDALFRDFTVRFSFKVAIGNSGFCFGGRRVDDPRVVHGLQVEIEAGDRVGGLFEIGGRDWLVVPDPDAVAKAYRPDAWNDMVVAVHDGGVSVFVNGRVTAVLAGEEAREGHLGFQLHRLQEMDVSFKGVEILMADR